MKKNGFTLIEIIICIALIAIISTTSIIILRKNKNSNIEKINKQLFNAATVFIANEEDDNGSYYEQAVNNGAKGVKIPISYLEDKGYIDKNLKNELYNHYKLDKNQNYYLLAYADGDGTKDTEDFCDQGDITFIEPWTMKEKTPVYLCKNYNNEEAQNNIKGDLAKKILEYYKYSTEIPDFKKSSPSSLDENKPYKEITDSNSSKVCTITYKNESKSSKNSHYYFGESYTFNSTIGKFELSNSTKLDMEQALSEGKKYMCTDENCKTMYEINSFYSKISGYTYTAAGNRTCIRGDCYYKKCIDNGITHKVANNYGFGDSGLYRYFDDDGYTYYFRGKINNNYVKLYNKKNNTKSGLFKILRFNGNGTIKLLYDKSLDTNGTDMEINFSTPVLKPVIDNKEYFQDTTGVYVLPSNKARIFDNVEMCCENNSESVIIKKWTDLTEGEYIYFDHGCKKISRIVPKGIYYNKIKWVQDGVRESDGLQLLNKWYDDNIKNDFNQIVTLGKFCIDNNEESTDGGESTYFSPIVLRLKNFNPSLICSNQEQKYDLNVGLITEDEIILMGYGEDKTETDFNIYNNISYTQNITDNSLINNIFLDTNNKKASFYTMNSRWHSKSASTSQYTPVINIKNSVKIDSGNGTKENPFLLYLDDDSELE